MGRARRETDLAAVRRLLADGAAQLPSDQDALLALARRRLGEADRELAAVPGSGPGWGRRLLEPAAALACGWLVATVATAIGFGGAWVIAVTAVLVLLAAGFADIGFTRRWGPALDRRRAGPAPVSTETPRPLTEVPPPILAARGRLVSAALRRVPRGRWHPPYLARRIVDDRMLRRIALADLLLCQAIDCLEQRVRPS